MNKCLNINCRHTPTPDLTTKFSELQRLAKQVGAVVALIVIPHSDEKTPIHGRSIHFHGKPDDTLENQISIANGMIAAIRSDRSCRPFCS